MKIFICFSFLVVSTLATVVLPPETTTAPPPAPPEPNPVLNLVTILSGKYFDYDSAVKALSDGTSRSRLSMIFRPVEVAALGSPLALFLEFERGKSKFQRIMVFSEDDIGQIHMTPYTRLKNKRIRYNNVPGLTDLVTERECNIILKQIEDNVYFGEWPDCEEFRLVHAILNAVSHETQPGYSMVITCNSMAFESCDQTGEKITTAPFLLKQIERYPLEPGMLEGNENFVFTC